MLAGLRRRRRRTAAGLGSRHAVSGPLVDGGRQGARRRRPAEGRRKVGREAERRTGSGTISKTTVSTSYARSARTFGGGRGLDGALDAYALFPGLGPGVSLSTGGPSDVRVPGTLRFTPTACRHRPGPEPKRHASRSSVPVTAAVAGRALSLRRDEPGIKREHAFRQEGGRCIAPAIVIRCERALTGGERLSDVGRPLEAKLHRRDRERIGRTSAMGGLSPFSIAQSSFASRRRCSNL